MVKIEHRKNICLICLDLNDFSPQATEYQPPRKLWKSGFETAFCSDRICENVKENVKKRLFTDQEFRDYPASLGHVVYASFPRR